MNKNRLRCKSNILRASDEEFEAKLSKLDPEEREFAIRHRKRKQALVAPHWSAIFESLRTGVTNPDYPIECPNCGGKLCCVYSGNRIKLSCKSCGAESPNSLTIEIETPIFIQPVTA